MYGGALSSFLRAMYWKVWILFEFLALPHSWMPQVHTGLIKDLYMSSFALILVNLLLLINVLRRRKREFKFNCLDLIWWAQVNLQSRVSPRYLTAWEFEIVIPWMETAGQGVNLRVKVQCTDFDWFIFNRQLVYHSSMRKRWFWRWREAITGSLFTEIIALSSA